MNLLISDDTRVRFGKAFAAAAVVLSVAGLLILGLLGRWDVLTGTDALYFSVLGVGFGTLTWLMIRPEAANGSVWSLAWAALFAGMFTAGLAFTVLLSRGSIEGLTYESLTQLSPADLPRPAAVAVSFRFWAVVPALWLPLTLGLLLFPDGRFLNRFWRGVGWLSAGAIAAGTVATALAQNPWSTLPISSGDDTLPGTIGSVIDTSFALASLGALFSVGSLIARYRRSTGTTRSQIRWIAFGGAAFAIGLVVGPSLGDPNDEVLNAAVGMAMFSLLIVSYGVAITRYRLYGIDVVISRTFTYGVLAAFITGVYALIVVGIGSLLGSGDQPNLGLSITAIAVVAVAFEPLRSRVQHWANRLVYGKRATPYEVLSQATTQLAGTGAPDETLSQVARLVVDGTGASAAVLWLRVGAQLQPYSAAPPEALDGLTSVPVVGEDASEIPGDGWMPVRHREALLGAVSIIKNRGQSVTAADEKVLADVAAGSGLLLRNISLNAELTERAEQLRASRRRLIAAQDDERHRLERDLHDGAQQQVVALKVKLGIARTLAEREGTDDLAEIVSGLSEQVQETVDAMREVAHGIYPPLLEAEGLESALSAAMRRASIPVSLASGGLGRLGRSIEECLYFCVLGTVTRGFQDGASSARVDLIGAPGEVRFMVHHDGATDELVPVKDRVEAFGGRFSVEDTGGGVDVVGRVPTIEPAVRPPGDRVHEDASSGAPR